MSSFNDDDGNSAGKPQKGLGKVSPRKSIISQMAASKQEQKNFFENRVDNIENQKNEIRERANSLAIDFMKIMGDKTLHMNKSVVNSIEKDVLRNLIQFSIDLNNDPVEQSDGMGSTAIISLLLKNCIASRDRLNMLEYENTQLKVEMRKMQEAIQLLGSTKEKP